MLKAFVCYPLLVNYVSYSFLKCFIDTKILISPARIFCIMLF